MFVKCSQLINHYRGIDYEVKEDPHGSGGGLNSLGGLTGANSECSTGRVGDTRMSSEAAADGVIQHETNELASTTAAAAVTAEAVTAALSVWPMVLISRFLLQHYTSIIFNIFV